MKRRALLALPAVAPGLLPATAHAFRAEELPASFSADLAERCPRPGFHDALAARPDAGGAALPVTAREASATCPFCQCRVAWVPSADRR